MEAHAAAAAACCPAEDPAALRAELRRAQGSHVPAVLCRAAGRAPCSHQDGAVQECWILCAVGGEVYITEQGAEHSAEHGAVDGGDAERKQQATIAVWRLLAMTTVLLRCGCRSCECLMHIHPRESLCLD
jgi:hypothetical protein